MKYYFIVIRVAINALRTERVLACNGCAGDMQD